MANNQNLKPALTSEEARERGRRGGIKSGEKRRQRKTFRECILTMLEDGDVQKNIIAALFGKAFAGDVRAFESIRDTIGEKPTDKTELVGDITLMPAVKISGKEKDFEIG